MKKKHLIWSNDADQIDSIQEAIMEDARAEGKELSEDEALTLAYQENWEQLEDERMNLSIETRGNIICIADLGLWNGRRSAYKFVGKNIRNCLYMTDGDFGEWFVDGYGNLRGTEHHHDGTNHYLYREMKPELPSSAREHFCSLVYQGIAKASDVSRYTKSLGKRVKEVYGW